MQYAKYRDFHTLVLWHSHLGSKNMYSSRWILLSRPLYLMSFCNFNSFNFFFIAIYTLQVAEICFVQDNILIIITLNVSMALPKCTPSISIYNYHACHFTLRPSPWWQSGRSFCGMSQKRGLLFGPTAKHFSSDMLFHRYRSVQLFYFFAWWCLWLLRYVLLWSCVIFCRLVVFFSNMQKLWRKIYLQESFMNFCFFLCNG